MAERGDKRCRILLRPFLQCCQDDRGRGVFEPGMGRLLFGEAPDIRERLRIVDRMHASFIQAERFNGICGDAPRHGDRRIRHRGQDPGGGLPPFAVTCPDIVAKRNDQRNGMPRQCHPERGCVVRERKRGQQKPGPRLADIAGNAVSRAGMGQPDFDFRESPPQKTAMPSASQDGPRGQHPRVDAAFAAMRGERPVGCPPGVGDTAGLRPESSSCTVLSGASARGPPGTAAQ